MPQPSEASATPQVEDRAEVEAQIGRSLSAIWERRAGARPLGIDTTLETDVVRCVIEPGNREATDEAFESSIDSTSYRNEAIVSVTKLTRRKVTALIAKSPSKKKTTNTFILEQRRRSN